MSDNEEDGFLLVEDSFSVKSSFSQENAKEDANVENEEHCEKNENKMTKEYEESFEQPDTEANKNKSTKLEKDKVDKQAVSSTCHENAKIKKGKAEEQDSSTSTGEENQSIKIHKENVKKQNKFVNSNDDGIRVSSFPQDTVANSIASLDEKERNKPTNEQKKAVEDGIRVRSKEEIENSEASYAKGGNQFENKKDEDILSEALGSIPISAENDDKKEHGTQIESPNENKKDEDILSEALGSISISITAENDDKKEHGTQIESPKSSFFPGNSAFMSSGNPSFIDDFDDTTSSGTNGDSNEDWDSVSKFIQAELPDFNSINKFISSIKQMSENENVINPENVVKELAKLGATFQTAVESFSTENLTQKHENDKTDENNRANENEILESEKNNNDNEKKQTNIDPTFTTFFKVFEQRHVVHALQEFLYQPVVTDILVDICKTGKDTGKVEMNALISRLGEILSALASLFKIAPELLALIPECGKLFTKFYFENNDDRKNPEKSNENKNFFPNDFNSDISQQPNIVQKDEWPAKTEHRHVICDGCDSRERKTASKEDGNRNKSGYICGFRWKSAIHEDFDLCSTCEASNDFEEKYGPFLKISTPKKAPRELLVVLRDQSSVHQSSNVPSHCNSGNTSNTSNSSKCSSHLKYPRTQCGGPIINNSRKNNNTYASKCNISKNNYQQIPQKEEKLQNLMKSHNNSGLSCASGHILNYFKTPNSSFTCDACNVSFLTNTEMAGCRRCNFDLCLSCITLQGKSFSQSTSSSCSVTNRSSSISSQTSKSENQCGPPRAKFICDVSLPDGSILKVDETAVKSWRISNPGTAQWPIGVQLVHVGGHLLGSQNPMPIPSLHPKEEFNLALPIQAPAHPGRYVGYWRLMTSGNNQSRFGHRLWADITCVEKDKLEESQTYLKYKTQHDKLKELGYSNIARNIDILERHNGDLDKAIFEMLDGKDESQ